MRSYASNLVALAALLVTPFAFAQDATTTQTPAPDTEHSERGTAALEEVLVTAQKRQESSLNVPIAISTLSEAQMENLNMTSMYDLALITPGLVTASQAGNSIPFLRGVGSTIAFTGSDSSVSTFIDGFYLAYDQGTMQDLFDAERIEVLKGPQATLYGRNATGGAINYISKKPNTKEYDAKVSVGFGSRSKREANIYFTGPLTDTLAFSIAAMGKERDSYIHAGTDANPAPSFLNTKEQRYAARAKLLWQPVDAYQAELSFSYANKDSFEDAVYIPLRSSSTEVVALGFPVAYAEDNTLLTGTSVRNDIEQKLLFLTQTVNLSGDLTLRSLTGFTDTKQNADIPLGGSSVPFFSVGDYDGFGSRQGSQELQLLSAPDKTFTWIVGANYFHSRDGTGPGYTYLPLFGIQAFQNVKQLTDSFAGFAEGTYHATDRLSVTLGGRWTHDKRELPEGNYISAVRDAPEAQRALIPQTDKTWSKISYKAAVQYALADRTNVYVTHARGFKSGVYNIPGLSTVSNVPVEPETLKSYEVGLKSELFDRRVRLDSAVFVYDLSGTQAQVIDTAQGGNATLTSAGDSSIKGFEFSSMFAATEGLNLGAGFAYLDTEYKDFVGFPAWLPGNGAGGLTGAGGNIQVPLSVVGNRIVYTPKWTANANASYTIPLAGGSLTASGVWSFSDSYCMAEECRRPQSAYHIVNAAVSFKSADERWGVTVYGENLLSEKYLVNYLQLPTGDLGRFAQKANGGVRFEYSF